MRVHVRDGYFVGFGRHIASGDYNEDDPGLFGMAASYLVANGHASVIDDVEELPDEPGTSGEDTPKPLEEMSAEELKALATSMGLEFGSRTTKPKLIDLIEGVEEEKETGDDDPAV